MRTLEKLAADVVRCERCPRLCDHRRSITGKKGPYWNRPVPGFGDPKARLLVIGLAPGAQGANRTGRPFTGDFAGDLLYKALHVTGFSSAERSVSVDDGLELKGAWITNVCRCVPPQNKPESSEVANCAPFLAEELGMLKEVRVVLALGALAHTAYLRFVKAHGLPSLKMKDHKFGHGARHEFGHGRPVLYDTYHSSRYNVSTRVLKWDMFEDVVRAAARAARTP